MAKKGWYGEKQRHSLAARGIKTSVNSPKRFKSHFNSSPTFDYRDVEFGDLVDFGPYGKLYVVNGNSRKWWVTNEESERYNPNAAGWYIDPSDAVKIIEKGEGEEIPRTVL